MSSVYIKVNTDLMIRQSNQVREDVSKIDRNWKGIGDLIKRSKSYWEGEASDAHIKAYKEIEDAVNKVIKSLAENAVKLITAGIAVDISNLRYIKLNRYERVNENGGNSDG
jgi:uncharacterized protein YukE